MSGITSGNELAEAVLELAEKTVEFDDVDLGQPYRWGAHQEGVRFALLGAMHELRTLAVQMAAKREAPRTRAQHALSQYHAAYRDLQAVLLSASEEEYEKPPAPGEWPLRYVYGHMVAVERKFFALVHYGVRRQREGGEMAPALPEGEADRLIGPYEVFDTLMNDGRQDELSGYHAILHDRALSEFAAISDAELEGPSLWWEGKPYSLEYRLHRMDAHLSQHTVQVEKTRSQLGRAPGEARRLLRLVFAALAEAEGVAIGVPTLCDQERLAAAESIRAMAHDAVEAVAQANAFIAAVTAGDQERVRSLVEEAPQLANATSRDGVPVVRLAVYYGHQRIAEMLFDSPGFEPEIWDGAVLGRREMVEQAHVGWGDFILNEYSRDGYTPLQLACFFGRENVARYLVEKGADVNAVSHNVMAIQPLHAAAAGDHLGIVKLLLEVGADANGVQEGGFRPLHTAAQNGSIELAHLLLEHGADVSLADHQDRFPRDLVADGGNVELIALLSPS